VFTALGPTYHIIVSKLLLTSASHATGTSYEPDWVATASRDYLLTTKPTNPNDITQSAHTANRYDRGLPESKDTNQPRSFADRLSERN
jgi:hypothetical protein